MMDIGWSELLLIGVVALIVIGPQDLPKMFHTLGRITARARSMAREFSSAMEDAAKQSGLSDATRDLNDLRNIASPKSLGLDALDRAADRFEKWQPGRPGAATRAQPDPGLGGVPAAPAEDEVVTFRKAPTVPAAPAPAAPSAPASTAPAAASAPASAPSPASAPAAEGRPIRRTSARSRRKTPETDA